LPNWELVDESRDIERRILVLQSRSQYTRQILEIRFLS